MSKPIDALAEFLQRGESYGLPGVAVSRIETHCSEVFLVGNQAYKLKRPVAFSSVDYGTIARRETACRAEIEMNRRTAPELYLANHTVRRRMDGTLGLDGEGEIVDWLVAMRRFDQADLFDHLAQSGTLSPALMRDLAKEILRFHANAEITLGSGGAAGMRDAIERNHRDLETMVSIVGRAKIDQLHARTLDALEPLAGRLDLRRAKQGVRRVHGDLRLANICLIEGRPTLFDGIEFDDSLSCIDVLYDLAFLLADLHHRNCDLLANVVFNCYLDGAADSDDLEVLPLMLSVRAATRAYGLAGSAQRRARAVEAARFAASAKSMLGLALALLRGARPRLVAIGGLGGGRKNAIVERVAAGMLPVPGARIVRSGIARRKVIGLAAEDRLAASAYRAEISDRVYEMLTEQARHVLAAGHSVVIDASFFYPRHRERVRALADEAGVPVTGLWLGDAREMLRNPAAPSGDWHVIGLDEPSRALRAARRLMGVLPTG